MEGPSSITAVPGKPPKHTHTENTTSPFARASLLGARGEKGVIDLGATGTKIPNYINEVITWVVPLPSNSHHQDYYIFSRGFL